MANLLEQLQQAGQLVREVATMEQSEQKAYIELLKEAYFDFQQAAYGIIDEYGVILQNFKWKEKQSLYFQNDKRLDLKSILDKEAIDFAFQYGYSKDAVKEIIVSKNNYTSLIKTDFNRDYPNCFIYYVLVPKA